MEKPNDYDHIINLQKSSPDFKRGFVFSMRCIIDMASNKPDSYTIAELLDFLHNFLLVNHSMENIESMTKIDETTCGYKSCMLNQYQHYHLDEYTVTFINPEDKMVINRRK
jgi:hypothetical protein